jgi:hypothetical protein
MQGTYLYALCLNIPYYKIWHFLRARATGLEWNLGLVLLRLLLWTIDRDFQDPFIPYHLI